MPDIPTTKGHIMSIITINRGSCSRGKEVAEKLALKLGYECISRDILMEAADEFNIPEIKLIRALHDPASVLERFTHGKDRYIELSLCRTAPACSQRQYCISRPGRTVFSS